MTDENQKQRRLSLSDLHTERERAVAEKKEREQKGRALANRLTQAKQQWDTFIPARLSDAVNTANRLVANQGIRLFTQPADTQPPNEAHAHGYKWMLPGLAVFQYQPVQPKRPGAKAARPTPTKGAPLLSIRVGPDGKLVVTKANYKNGTHGEQTADISSFSSPMLETLVVDFVNDGLFGLPPDEAAVANPSSEPQTETVDRPDPNLDTPTAPSKTDVPPSEVKTPQVHARVAKSLKENQQPIEYVAAALLELLDERIEALSSKRPNSEESIADWENELANYRDLKARIEAFLQAARQFVADKASEAQAVTATISFATGVKNWWTANHVKICDTAFDSGLVGVGFALVYLAGAGPILATIVPAAVVKGKPVVDAITKWAGKNAPE